MAIHVRFPDGSLRDVPSDLRHYTAPDGAMAFANEPLDCDVQWRFVRDEAGWRAEPRHGRVTRLVATADEWWRAVPVMADNPRGESPTTRAA